MLIFRILLEGSLITSIALSINSIGEVFFISALFFVGDAVWGYRHSVEWKGIQPVTMPSLCPEWYIAEVGTFLHVRILYFYQPCICGLFYQSRSHGVVLGVDSESGS